MELRASGAGGVSERARHTTWRGFVLQAGRLLEVAQAPTIPGASRSHYRPAVRPLGSEIWQARAGGPN